MPRDGSGNYSLPAGTQATTGTAISSTKYNAFVEDVESDLNTARPISAGGTGAASASAARDELGVSGKVSSQGGTYTALAADRTKVLTFTATATLNLTAAATLADGWWADVDANGGDVTIDPDGSETIDGATTLVVPDGSTVRIHCDGTAFLTTASGLIATAAEAQAGTDNTKIMSPKRVADVSGWQLVETFYDSGTDGTVTEIETADWEDGYQYAVVFNDLSPDTASLSRLSIALYIDAAASYSSFNAFGADPVTNASQKIGGMIEFKTGRLEQFWHFFPWQAYTDENGTHAGSVDTTLDWKVIGTTHATATKIGKIKLKFTAGNIDGGNASLYRMRSAV